MLPQQRSPFNRCSNARSRRSLRSSPRSGTGIDLPSVGSSPSYTGPVGSFEILEDDASIAVAVRSLAPNVKVARLAAGRRTARPLEPRMFIGRVVDDQLGNHAQAAPMGFRQKLPK